MGIVRRGDSVALKRWLASAPPVQSGTIAPDQLRQLRNLFIVTATLVSRAAIRGGMRQDDAFSLSDAYIQRVELLTSHSKILNLQYNMLLEFTEQVEKLRRGQHTTKLSLDVANYVRHHLSEQISVEKMAGAFYLSRPYLSVKFKQETGQTLTDFILKKNGGSQTPPPLFRQIPLRHQRLPGLFLPRPLCPGVQAIRRHDPQRVPGKAQIINTIL